MEKRIPTLDEFINEATSVVTDADVKKVQKVLQELQFEGHTITEIVELSFMKLQIRMPDHSPTEYMFWFNNADDTQKGVCLGKHANQWFRKLSAKRIKDELTKLSKLLETVNIDEGTTPQFKKLLKRAKELGKEINENREERQKQLN